MRKRGTYDQAALLLDQQALQESSPERAMKSPRSGEGGEGTQRRTATRI